MSDRGDDADRAPVSVRDLMRRLSPDQESARESGAEPAWQGVEEAFEAEGEAWIARAAGAGSYGTGRLGAARLVAVHFFREDDPSTPLREALIAAGRFPHLRPDELRTLLERATPIEQQES